MAAAPTLSHPKHPGSGLNCVDTAGTSQCEATMMGSHLRGNTNARAVTTGGGKQMHRMALALHATGCG